MNNTNAPWKIVDLNNQDDLDDKPNFFAVRIEGGPRTQYFVPGHCNGEDCGSTMIKVEPGTKPLSDFAYCTKCGTDEDFCIDYDSTDHKHSVVMGLAAAMFKSDAEIEDLYERAMLRAQAERVME